MLSLLILLALIRGVPTELGFFQEVCRQNFQDYPESHLFQGFFCGWRDPAAHTEWRFWKSTGLLPLLVISGYHISHLARWLSNWDQGRWHKPEGWISWVLLAYGGITGFQPPTVRAFIQWRLERTYPFWISLIISLPLTLLIQPQWWSNGSFWLSALSRIILGACQLQFPSSNFLSRVAVYVILGWIVGYWHPAFVLFQPLWEMIWLLIWFSGLAIGIFHEIWDHPLTEILWLSWMAALYATKRLLMQAALLWPSLKTPPHWEILRPLTLTFWVAFALYAFFKARRLDLNQPNLEPCSHWKSWAFIYWAVLIFSPQSLSRL